VLQGSVSECIGQFTQLHDIAFIDAKPVMISKIFSSMDMLSSAFDSRSRHCVEGIVCNGEHCK